MKDVSLKPSEVKRQERKWELPLILSKKRKENDDKEEPKGGTRPILLTKEKIKSKQ